MKTKTKTETEENLSERKVRYNRDDALAAADALSRADAGLSWPKCKDLTLVVMQVLHDRGWRYPGENQD